MDFSSALLQKTLRTYYLIHKYQNCGQDRQNWSKEYVNPPAIYHLVYRFVNLKYVILYQLPAR